MFYLCLSLALVGCFKTWILNLFMHHVSCETLRWDRRHHLGSHFSKQKSHALHTGITAENGILKIEYSMVLTFWKFGKSNRKILSHIEATIEINRKKCLMVFHHQVQVSRYFYDSKIYENCNSIRNYHLSAKNRLDFRFPWNVRTSIDHNVHTNRI